jgi:hypothetical protein
VKKVAFWNLKTGEVLGVAEISDSGKVTVSGGESGRINGVVDGLSGEEILVRYSNWSNGYTMASSVIDADEQPNPLEYEEGGAEFA